jgi:hypothetical protein
MGFRLIPLLCPKNNLWGSYFNEFLKKKIKKRGQIDFTSPLCFNIYLNKIKGRRHEKKREEGEMKEGRKTYLSTSIPLLLSNSSPQVPPAIN